jgi:hypothetical protein
LREPDIHPFSVKIWTVSGSRFPSALSILAGAAIVGVVVGAGSLMGSSPGRIAGSGVATKVGVAAGVARLRAPQPGDSWGGCNDARAAGTAPIYRDEPGYRAEMDGDGDGVACEPISN